METNTHKEQHENLTAQEGVEKLKELIDHNSICLFSTDLKNIPFTSRPMTVQKVDDYGNLWMLSAKDSDKNLQIAENPEVQLFFAKTSDSEFLTVYGKASIHFDRARIDELWEPIAKAWFTEGKDDPRISVIKIEPVESYYWDTRNGRMISMLKIIGSAIAGKKPNEGVEGTLKV